MVGTNFQNSDMRWTKTTDLDTLDTSLIHGHIFILAESSFHAYEFQDGALPDLNHVGQDFLADFSLYLTDNNLADVIGLRVLEDRPCNSRPRACMANETHLKMTTGNHKVFNTGKPLPKLENVEELKASLVEAGVM
ncbi:hypothetical protein F503_01353 [Ophiostoma piceae UAMH 11346]|uniref:Uncharacterized protein n=1 Tax=Ophiostoma piceae (strain UAMH 11346) TaxID=1262450 RepID=S3BSV2_OPHP1|nr:hypothetical protein F503_01353 [Ophiostoma piceae UAMH 11346]